jgi:hypothetical protein
VLVELEVQGTSMSASFKICLSYASSFVASVVIGQTFDVTAWNILFALR